jgi:predicted MFS family arabinose efflux permease
MVTRLLADRGTVLSLTCCLLFGFVLGLGFLTVPLYTLSLTDAPIVLALVVGTFPLTSLLVSLTSGALSDYFGSRRVMVSAFASMAGACVVFAASDTYRLLLVGQVLFALGGISFYTSALASLMSLAPPERQYALQGLGSGIIRTGTIVGPFVGGLLVRFAGFEAAFLAGAVVALVGLIVSLALDSGVGTTEGSATLAAYVVDYHRKAWRLLERNPAIRWANGLHAVGTLCWGAVGGSYYLSFLTESGFSASDAGLLRASHLIVATLAQLSAGYLTGYAPATTLAAASIALGGFTLGTTPFLHQFSTIAVVGSLGGMSWIYLPVLLGFSSEHTDPAERSISVALFNVTWGLANPAALLVLAIIVERVSLGSAFVVSGVFALLCSTLLWMWANRRLV